MDTRPCWWICWWSRGTWSCWSGRLRRACGPARRLPHTSCARRPSSNGHWACWSRSSSLAGSRHGRSARRRPMGVTPLHSPFDGTPCPSHSPGRRYRSAPNPSTGLVGDRCDAGTDHSARSDQPGGRPVNSQVLPASGFDAARYATALGPYRAGRHTYDVTASLRRRPGTRADGSEHRQPRTRPAAVEASCAHRRAP